MAHANAEIEEFVRLATAASSRNGYQADFGYFATWCEAHGLAAMPASPTELVLHVGCATQYVLFGEADTRAAG